MLSPVDVQPLLVAVRCCNVSPIKAKKAATTFRVPSFKYIISVSQVPYIRAIYALLMGQGLSPHGLRRRSS